eukprot:1146741-Ditylum_brightwellii.AAC.1
MKQQYQKKDHNHLNKCPTILQTYAHWEMVSKEPTIDSAGTENEENATGNNTENDAMTIKENIVVDDVP